MEIIPIYLIVGMFVTFLIIYMMYPDPKVVYVNPRVSEKISNVYRDENNVCYRYHRSDVTCPSSV